MTAFTIEDLCASLEPKCSVRVWGRSAQDLADIIRDNGLAEVIAGRHDGRAVTYARGYELIYGERLR